MSVLVVPAAYKPKHMTHSLHRFRITPASNNDFVFLCTPAIGVNHEGSRDKLIAILHIILSLEPDNINFYEAETGTYDLHTVISSIRDTSRLRCCFSDRNKVKALLKRLQEEDYGLSIVISAPQEEVIEILREVGILPHTVNISGGFFGKTCHLPDTPILEILTMCGHGLVSKNLILDSVEKIKTGDITIDEAVKRISSPCTCGIFNPERTKMIIEKLHSEKTTQSG